MHTRLVVFTFSLTSGFFVIMFYRFLGGFLYLPPWQHDFRCGGVVAGVHMFASLLNIFLVVLCDESHMFVI